MSRNLAASIRARLKQRPDASKQNFNLTLTLWTEPGAVALWSAARPRQAHSARPSICGIPQMQTARPGRLTANAAHVRMALLAVLTSVRIADGVVLQRDHSGRQATPC
jgi:hypothetical protein